MICKVHILKPSHVNPAIHLEQNLVHVHSMHDNESQLLMDLKKASSSLSCTIVGWQSASYVIFCVEPFQGDSWHCQLGSATEVQWCTKSACAANWSLS